MCGEVAEGREALGTAGQETGCTILGDYFTTPQQV